LVVDVACVGYVSFSYILFTSVFIAISLSIASAIIASVPLDPS
jgi:hypothetical protein